MILGVPKEIKAQEGRVALIPSQVSLLTSEGIKVVVQKEAGIHSGFTDLDYQNAGAELVENMEEVYRRADMVVKVKEPLPPEFTLLKEGKIIFTFFHFPSSKELTFQVIKSGCIAIAYENVEENGSFPILAPMSEIAGRIAIIEGARFLQREYGGKGILLGGTGEGREGNVLIIGGGNVGRSAAILADRMGSRVTILDIKEEVVKNLKKLLPSEARVLLFSEETLKEELKKADLVVGAVYSAGRRAPIVIKKAMLEIMEEGTVIVDVAIDQGGCVETSHPTTWDNPVFKEKGVIHFCVANIPGSVPRTSTLALTRASFPYVKELASKGLKALKDNPALKKGLTIGWGKVFHPAVSEAFDLPKEEADKYLS